MPDVIKLIREMYPELSSAKKSAASYFLNHYTSLQFATVTELAEQIGVSDTTIINLCSDLGFSGFAGFKRAVREDIQQEKKPEETAGSTADTSGFNIQESVRNIQDGILGTFSDASNLAALNQAAQLINGAKCIYAIGFWSSATLAQDLCLNFRRQGWRAEAIFPSLGDYIDKVLQITPEDIVILYDFARYISGIQEVCLLLQKQNVPIILITDMGACPSLPYATCSIHCHSSGSNERYITPSASIVGYLLRNMTAAQNPRIRDDYAELREGVFTRFNPYGVIEPDKKYTDRV